MGYLTGLVGMLHTYTEEELEEVYEGAQCEVNASLHDRQGERVTMYNVGDVRTIGSLKGEGRILVTDCIEVTDTLDAISKRSEDYDGLLVKLDASGADYLEVWGFCGTFPYNSKLAKLLYVAQ
jgi:hypothetical protein